MRGDLKLFHFRIIKSSITSDFPILFFSSSFFFSFLMLAHLGASHRALSSIAEGGLCNGAYL